MLARNIISANAGDGVDVSNGATDTLIQGNYIGVDQTGTQPLGNTGNGISVNDAAGITIGGTAQGAANVISANVQAGVSIQGSASTGSHPGQLHRHRPHRHHRRGQWDISAWP